MNVLLMEGCLCVCAGFFLTKIFHPNVASNGAICVNTLKRDWKPEHGIRHILLVRRTNLQLYLYCSSGELGDAGNGGVCTVKQMRLFYVCVHALLAPLSVLSGAVYTPSAIYGYHL